MIKDGPMTASNTELPTSSETNCRDEGSKQAPGLYLVSTPIGNLGDITGRAMKILANVDLIACEDSRVTGKLLMLLGLPSKSLIPYHEHNAEKTQPILMQKLRNGLAVALVSDAGAPLISDPGYRLVRCCAEEDIPVTAIPGASAALMALQLSGLPCHRFLFEGFLASKRSARQRQIELLSSIPATLIFYESPHRLIDSLADLLDVLGDRPAAVARELTKLHEEVRRASLSDLCAHYQTAGAPKGEIVIVVAPPEEEGTPDEADIDQALIRALADMSIKDAVSAVAAQMGMKRRVIYQRALALAEKNRAPDDEEA